MTIKEIEERSGLARANIRFYESEGLLTPQRKENGYREYSEEDLTTLLRIKLLRALGVSLDDIKALQRGDTILDDTLAQRLIDLEREQAQLEKSGAVCREMREDRVSYPTLEPRRYLEDLEGRDSPPAGDAVPRVRSPWRRYFARALDLSLYSLPMWVFLTFQKHPSLWGAGYRFLGPFTSLILMVLLEPVLLHRFGTTPGKWFLGLSVVSDATGGRPTYGEAQERTMNLLWYGMGFRIPVYSLYRMWKSKQVCEEGKALEWEDATSLVLTDRVWNIPVYCLARALAAGLVLLAIPLAALPKHRGDLTVAEFCDNYNRLQRYYSASDPFRELDENGKWITKGMVVTGGDPEPEFVFTEENGVLTGLRYTYELSNGSGPFFGQGTRQTLSYAMLAYLHAQPGSDLFGRNARVPIAYLEKHPNQDFHFTVNGVEVDCRVTCRGYSLAANGTLWPTSTSSEGERWYSLRFEMKKQ